MNIFTSTYRQTWKAGLVIVLATCGSALLATHGTDRGPATPTYESKATGQTTHPAFGSNSWFGLYATDANVLAD
jgi:hypothetical protein